MKYALIVGLCAVVLLGVVGVRADTPPSAQFACDVVQLQLDYVGGPYIGVTCITGFDSWDVYMCASVSVNRSSEKIKVDCYDVPHQAEPTYAPYPEPEQAPLPVRKIFRNKD